MARSTKRARSAVRTCKMKIDQMNARNEKKVVRTWSRRS